MRRGTRRRRPRGPASRRAPRAARRTGEVGLLEARDVVVSAFRDAGAQLATVFSVSGCDGAVWPLRYAAGVLRRVARRLHLLPPARTRRARGAPARTPPGRTSRFRVRARACSQASRLFSIRAYCVIVAWIDMIGSLRGGESLAAVDEAVTRHDRPICGNGAAAPQLPPRLPRQGPFALNCSSSLRVTPARTWSASSASWRRRRTSAAR